MGYGEDQEKCGGGGAGAAGWIAGRKGAGGEADAGAAGRERPEGGAGAVVEEKMLKKLLAYA